MERATRPFRPATSRTGVVFSSAAAGKSAVNCQGTWLAWAVGCRPARPSWPFHRISRKSEDENRKSKVIHQAPSGAASSDPATRLLCHSTFASIKKKRGCRPYGARKEQGLRWLHRCRASGAPRAAVEVEFTVRSATVSVVAPGYSGTGDSSVPSGHWPDGCSLFPLPPPGNLP